MSEQQDFTSVSPKVAQARLGVMTPNLVGQTTHGGEVSDSDQGTGGAGGGTDPKGGSHGAGGTGGGRRDLTLGPDMTAMHAIDATAIDAQDVAIGAQHASAAHADGIGAIGLRRGAR